MIPMFSGTRKVKRLTEEVILFADYGIGTSGNQHVLNSANKAQVESNKTKNF